VGSQRIGVLEQVWWLRLLATIAAVAVLVSTLAGVAEAAPDAICVESMRAQAASNRAMVATVSDAIVLKVIDEATAAYWASDADRKGKVLQYASALTAAVAVVTGKPSSEFVKEVAILQVGATLRQLDQLATIRRNSGMTSVGKDVEFAAIDRLREGIVLAALTSCESRP
jgi:hypothetical protein